MTPWLDEADLVHVAAAATARDPGHVLAEADVAGLASVAAALEGATSAVDAAATAVLEIGHRRPFGRDSGAIAWLAAAHVLAGDGRRLRIGPITASTVLAAGAVLDVADVAGIIREHSEPRLGPVRHLVRRLFTVHWPDGPGVQPCPACGRMLLPRRHDLVAGGGMWTDVVRLERIARCSVEHRRHDRWGAGSRCPAVAGGEARR